MAKTIPINGIIGWDVTAQDVRDALAAAKGEDVEFPISSPGGLVGEGLAIFNLIRNYPGNTKAILSGYAMSMASYIPQACKEVVAEDNAVYMIHNARGGVWGDHNEIMKYGQFVKGLSGILAKEYGKAAGKRGKATTAEDFTAMMDAESFLFGDQMTEHGLVDSIIPGDSGGDQQTAMLTARAAYDDCVAKMTADPYRVKADIQQAMALFQPPVASVISTPAVAAGNKTQEVRQMATLAELLAANPAAQVEFDNAVQAARTEGKKEMQTIIAAATPFLNNANYPKQVGEMAVKVLSGEQTAANLTALAATADMLKEMQSTGKATEETGNVGETPAQQMTPATDPHGEIADEAGLQALVAQFKGGN